MIQCTCVEDIRYDSVHLCLQNFFNGQKPLHTIFMSSLDPFSIDRNFEVFEGHPSSDCKLGECTSSVLDLGFHQIVVENFLLLVFASNYTVVCRTRTKKLLRGVSC